VALGASRATIVWLVLRSGLLIGVSGVSLGLAGTILIRRVVARLLFGSAGVDPLITFGVGLVLVLVVVMAGAMPARRALHVDPVTALRSE
jgi:putative ABC transport system permease protein